MACETILGEGQTLAQRMDQIKAALKRLEAALLAGQARVNIGPNGALAFQDWKDRDDVTDACAVRTLTAEGSWALRKAIARAEVTSGRKVNFAAVASGFHSHDGGKTWGKH